MRYEILGPLRITNDEGTRSIAARKIEVLLALLLIRANQVVSTEEVIAEIWGGCAPDRAIAAVHVYISKLRKLLGVDPQGDSPIVTRPPGYVFRLGAAGFDVNDLQALMQEGRTHLRGGRHRPAAHAFGEALRLWRGPVLGDAVSGPVTTSFVTWLEEARLECIESLIDSQLHLGLHRELVGWLFTLIGEYPLRETFYRQLMLGLCRSERQADALRVFHTARRTLNEELGLEPSRALQQLHAAILRADERLEVDAAA
ncbi:AfsR/SARP family transcriptional regulator [Dactylosporangium sp. NPDC051485]|uniref:AfsR/SARP family transcriptional regulator n=1 Tax=Dactylosporangium sp. NPDC051485 TaxID=3154846 RepID=UPI0034170170